MYSRVQVTFMMFNIVHIERESTNRQSSTSNKRRTIRQQEKLRNEKVFEYCMIYLQTLTSIHICR